MHPLEKKTRNTIIENRLVDGGEIVLVGVSGGPDSVALLHVLSVLAGGLGIRLVAACLDHGLRPGEAEQDVALVRNYAQAFGIAFEAGKADVRACAREKGLSVEHAGREIRYEFFHKAARKVGAVRIAVAHTADDQAEEVLLRLIRGTGRKGLSGMPPATEKGVIRPFLQIAKAEILGYLADRKISYHEDATNRDRSFLRNRVRLELLPFLEEHFNPNIREGLRQTAAILADEEEYLDEAATDAAAETIIVETSADENNCPRFVLLIEPFSLQSPAIQRRLLEKVLIDVGATPSFRQIDFLLALASDAETGAELHLAQGLRVTREKKRLVFGYPVGRCRVRGRLGQK